MALKETGLRKKVEERRRKKQETHEEAQPITGSEAHRDVTNTHPDKSPAPLARYERCWASRC